jgi:DNA-binding IclR family transcriptional regulator
MLALSLCVTRQRAHQLAQRVVSLGWARQAADTYRLTPSGTRILLASRVAQRAFDLAAKSSK